MFACAYLLVFSCVSLVFCFWIHIHFKSYISSTLEFKAQLGYTDEQGWVLVSSICCIFKLTIRMLNIIRLQELYHELHALDRFKQDSKCKAQGEENLNTGQRSY